MSPGARVHHPARPMTAKRQTERSLVYAIVRVAEGLVDGADGYTFTALQDTVTTWRAWLRRRARARRKAA